MELYYIVLTQIADAVGNGADFNRLAQFLRLCVDENLMLDLGRITYAIKQSHEKMENPVLHGKPKNGNI